MSENENEVLINTPLGKIRGSILKTWKESRIFAFRGIPYAESPIGENRFRSPVPKIKWDNILDATTDGFILPQMCTPPNEKVDKSLVSEDALILNVYTRNVNGKAPVLFYIHGGAFMFGGSHSEYFVSPAYILEQNLVFVTVNYRLGPFGFLSTGTKHATGNYGLKDQVMALKWVQNNISSFGGDPNCVTICGHSAGSMSVCLHLVSPMSRGLFHRAIAMSGSATISHKNDQNVEWTKKLAEFTKCPSLDDPEVIVKHLQSLTWQEMIDAVDSMDTSALVSLKWTWEIESNFGQEVFLDESPTTMLIRGDFARVPIITGITKDEFRHVFIEGLSQIPKSPPHLDRLFSKISENPDTIGSIKQFYTKDEPITGKDLAKIISDSVISHGVHRLVELASNYTNVYYYHFNFMGRFSFLTDKNGVPLGVAHGDCLCYFIRLPMMFPLIKPSDPEAKIVEKVTQRYGDFIRTGNPNPNKQNDPWKVAKCEKILKAFVIDNKDVLTDEPYHDIFMFWDKIYPVPK